MKTTKFILANLIMPAIAGVITANLGTAWCIFYGDLIKVPCWLINFLIGALVTAVVIDLIAYVIFPKMKNLITVKRIKSTNSIPYNEIQRIGLEIYNPNKDEARDVKIELISLVYIGATKKEITIKIKDGENSFENGNGFSDKNSIDGKQSAFVYLAEIRNNNIVFLIKEPYDNEYLSRFFSESATKLEGKSASLSIFRIKVSISAKIGRENTQEVFEDLIRFGKSTTFWNGEDYVMSNILIGKKIMEEKGLLFYAERV